MRRRSRTRAFLGSGNNRRWPREQMRRYSLVMPAIPGRFLSPWWLLLVPSFFSLLDFLPFCRYAGFRLLSLFLYKGRLVMRLATVTLRFFLRRHEISERRTFKDWTLHEDWCVINLRWFGRLLRSCNFVRSIKGFVYQCYHKILLLSRDAFGTDLNIDLFYRHRHVVNEMQLSLYRLISGFYYKLVKN